MPANLLSANTSKSITPGGNTKFEICILTLLCKQGIVPCFVNGEKNNLREIEDYCLCELYIGDYKSILKKCIGVFYGCS